MGAAKERQGKVNSDSPSRPQEQDPGPWRILRGVLFKPAATFDRLREARRRWWVMPLVLMVLAAGLSVPVSNRALQQQFQRAQQEYFEQLSPEEQLLQRPPEPAGYGTPPLVTGMSIAGQVLARLFTWLLWAGALALLGTFFGNNGVKFGGLFAMLAWAWLPYTLRQLLQVGYMLAAQSPIANPGLSGLVVDKAQWIANFGSLSYTVPTQGQLVGAALLERVDLYLFWHLFLLVLGVAAFLKLERKKALWLTLGIWALFTLVSLLPVLIGAGAGMGRLF